MVSEKVTTIISVILIIGGLAIWGATLVRTIPHTADEIEDICSDGVDHEYNVFWAIPTESFPIIGTDKVSVTYKDFHDSIHQLGYRYNCKIASVCDFINPDDKYVKKIVEYIDSYMPNASDFMKASIGLAYVQCAISYMTDEEQFQVSDYALYPVETLYLGKGDCEDTSILLCSIYRAMGFESRLANFPSHVSVLVTIDGVTYQAETTDHSVLSTTLTHEGFNPGEYKETHAILQFFSKASYWVRNGIYTVFGI